MSRRAKIRKVKRLDRHGCVIACAAMLAGISYEEAFWVWKDRCGGHDLGDEGYGITFIEARFLLKELGVELKPGLTPTLLFVDGINGQHSHAVVATENGKILDPDL